MSDAKLVCNSSPLIGLNQIKRLDILEQLFGTIIVPSAVAKEVAPSVPLLPDWITVKTLSQPIAARILETGLGAGESEAISLALELGNYQIILDDRAARRLAQSLGLSVIGTVGILLAAKRYGYINLIRPELDSLLNYGFHLAPAVYQQILSAAGE